MKVLLSPQNGYEKSDIRFDKDKVQIDGVLYDFSNLIEDGVMTNPNERVLKAIRKDGELELTIRNVLVGEDYTADDLYPSMKTIDRKDDFLDKPVIGNIQWLTSREVEEAELKESLKPSKEEIENAEFELKLIEKLGDWGII